MPRFTASDGIALHYTDTGPRPGAAILCLAGLTRNATDFDYVAPHLPDNRLVCLDYRGRGKSGWAAPETYTLNVEARDAIELLDHIGLERTAILGTSRGGLIAMILAATHKQRLTGLALNDIGPVLAPAGLDAIRGYIGKAPAVATHAEAAALMARRMAGFANVPAERWEAEARKHFVATDGGLSINYDPALAKMFQDTDAAPPADLWPLFEAAGGLPLALIRGANSDLLTPETADEMQRRRPDMIRAEVPDRGHIPFLDEPEALEALHRWVARL